MTDEQLANQPVFAYYEPHQFMTMEAFQTQQAAATPSTQQQQQPVSAASARQPVELEFGYARAANSEGGRTESVAGITITSSEVGDTSSQHQQQTLGEYQRNNQTNQTFPLPAPRLNNTTSNTTHHNQTTGVIPPTPITTRGNNTRPLNTTHTGNGNMTATGGRRAGFGQTLTATGTQTMTGRYYTATGTGQETGTTGVTGIVPAGGGTAMPSGDERDGKSVELAHCIAIVTALLMISIF